MFSVFCWLVLLAPLPAAPAPLPPLPPRYAWMESEAGMTRAESLKLIGWIEAHSGAGWPHPQMAEEIRNPTPHY